MLIAMIDEDFIRRALALAKRAEGKTSPNPMVGALIVKNKKIIAEGYHRKAGTAHAEVIAIAGAGSNAAGSTLYVTLEPCCHEDKRTPPCTKTIISSRIKKVVIAMKDPNPKVSGRGVRELRNAGIEVVTGVLEDKARALNEAYIKFISVGTPFVTLKVAMTLDGKIATPDGESKWITGEEARKEVHRLRSRSDAVLTAIGTVLADDPQLTCRTVRGRNPVRVVIDPDLETPVDANILTCPPRTIFVTAEASSQRKKLLFQKMGASVIEYPEGRCDMKWLMKQLAAEGMVSVLVEGGSSLSASCLEAGIVDKVLFHVAPKIIGGRESVPAVGGASYRRLSEAYRIEGIKARKIGQDIAIEGYVRHSHR